MSGARVTALGHYQPARVLDNHELASLVDTDDAWIRSRVGIQTRHIADPSESVVDLAGEAAAKALSGSQLDVEDVDLVVVTTCTAQDSCPNVAAQVAARLGIRAPAAYDLNTACSGFTYALATVEHAIRAGAARNAVVIGVDKMSDVADWTDRSSCVLLGDGAGAAVVSAADEDSAEQAGLIGPVLWGSVPELADKVTIGGAPARFAQDGQTVFRWATTALPAVARDVCARAGVHPSELAAFVPHQANLRIIEPLQRKLGAEQAVLSRDVVESGNTSAASVPLALSKLVARGDVTPGGPILLFGFGGGLTYAGQVIRCP